jgi:hypothetical protein
MRYVYDDRLFTKPIGFSLDKIPTGVTLYDGTTALAD